MSESRSLVHAAPVGQRPPAVEVLPERLYVVGGNVPLDGRVSWAPAAATGYQPANAHLLLGGGDVEETVIVDPGLLFVREQVLAGLRAAIPDGTQLRVFLTRAQFDCVGNLGAVAAELSVKDIFTGGTRNPFDSFDSATSADAERRAEPVVLFRAPADSRLEIINPTLRILATSWAYDAPTKTLFTSDAFTHATVADADDPPVVDSPESDTTTIDRVRDHLHATFWWLPHADKGLIAADVRDLFDRYEVDVIAPARGCVLKGKDVVARHVDLVARVLNEPSEAFTWHR